MSNYVYNRILCNNKAKEALEDADFWGQDLYFGRYEYKYNQLNEDLFEIKFDTCGYEYLDEQIRFFINKFRDTKWYCIEENITEQGYYFWNKDKVDLKVRKIDSNKGVIFEMVRYDTCWHWPNFCLRIDHENNSININDYELFESYIFNILDDVSKKLANLANKYVEVIKNRELVVPAYFENDMEDLTFFGLDIWVNVESELIDDKNKQYYENKYKAEKAILKDIKNSINKFLEKYNIPDVYHIRLNGYLDNFKDEDLPCVYKYVYVEYEDMTDNKTYCYLDNDIKLKKGDRVLVKRRDENAAARVVKIKKYTIDEVPYPVERMKSIIKKIDDDFKIDKYANYESSTGSEKPKDIFLSKESIFEYLEKHVQMNGTLDEDFTLDEYKIKKEDGINFADGLIDNVFLHDKDEEFLNFQEKLLDSLNEDNIVDNGNLTDKYFYEHQDVTALGNVDDFLNHIRSNTSKYEASVIFQYGIYLMLCSRTIESVKLGIALASLFTYEEDEEIVDVFYKLSLCDEFTKFTNLTLNCVNNSNEIRFKLAKRVKGWGKINLVEDLEVTNDYIKNWLITDGIKNDVGDNYLGIVIAEKVDLIQELSDKNLSAFKFDCLLRIFASLFDEGPRLGISIYEDRKKMFKKLLNIDDKYKNNLNYSIIIIDIKNYLTQNEPKNKKDIEKCKQILNSEIMKNNYKRVFASNDDAEIKHLICILDIMGNHEFDDTIILFFKLNPLEYFMSFNHLYKNKKYREEVVNIVNGIELSSDMMGNPKPIIDFEFSNELMLIQELNNHPFVGNKLIIGALNSETMHLRHSAIEVLLGWKKIKKNSLDDFPKEIINAVKKLKDKEPVPNLLT